MAGGDETLERPGYYQSPSGTRYLGFRLEAPPPVSEVFLPLYPGVHAIYGPTGVGKSRVLDGIVATLAPWERSSLLAAEPPLSSEENDQSAVSAVGEDGEAGKTVLQELLDWLRELEPQRDVDSYSANRVYLHFDIEDREYPDARVNYEDHESVRLLTTNLLGTLRHLHHQFDLAGDDDDTEAPWLDDVLAEADAGGLSDLALVCLHCSTGGGFPSGGLRWGLANEISHQTLFALGDSAEGSVVAVCASEVPDSSLVRPFLEGRRRSEATDDDEVAEAELWTWGSWTDEAFQGALFPHPATLDASQVPLWAPTEVLALNPAGPDVRLPRPSVLRVGESITLMEWTRSGTRTTEGAERLIRQLVARWDRVMAIPDDLEDDMALVPDFESAVEAVLFLANLNVTELLGESLELDLDMGGVMEVVRGTHPKFTALDSGTGARVAFTQLSASQQRWSEFALLLAFAGLTQRDQADGGPVVVIDEPEAGLPLSSQKILSRGLNSIAEDLRLPIYVATHSVGILDDLRATAYRCSRRADGTITVREVPSTSRTALTDLGVPISESLHLYRLVLVVEGHHEEVVLDELFGDVIADLRIKVLPIRGIRNLKHMTAAGELLFDHLAAPFVVVSDRARSDRVDMALLGAKAAEDREAAKTAVEAQLDGGSDEEGFIKSLLLSAVQDDRVHRIASIVGLNKDDILDYLPVEHFVAGGSWQALRDQHSEHRAAGNEVPRDFKRWLELHRDADFGDERIREAVGAMDEIHPDLTNLIATCSELVRQSRGDS